jgi:hypothetical protein
VAGVALVAALLLVAPAGTDVLCRAKSGRVFLRGGCKKRETAVELPAGPAGAAGDPGAAAPAPVRVVDAAGRQVGLLAEPGTEDNATFVLFEVGDRLVDLLVGTAGFPEDPTVFYHLAADCSDAPLVTVDPTAFVQRGVVLGSKAYYAGDPVETKTVAAYEEQRASGCGADPKLANGLCCRPSGGTNGVGPATEAVDLSQFTPPFRLEP